MSIDIEQQRARIIERRRAIGIDQRAVARLGGLSQSAVVRIERGYRPATVPELVGIAHATGSSVGYLTGRSPVLDRVKVAARAADGADTRPVQDRLRYLLEMDGILDDILDDAG